jgi:hypothetical protein
MFVFESSHTPTDDARDQHMKHRADIDGPTERSQEQEERFEADFARILVDEQLADESNDEPIEE